jgi:hypothetical protein
MCGALVANVVGSTAATAPPAPAAPVHERYFPELPGARGAPCRSYCRALTGTLSFGKL